MIISQRHKRIQHCLSIAESMNLTNAETETLTLQLADLLKKMVPQLVTKSEWHDHKNKQTLFSSFDNLNAIFDRLNQPETPFQWVWPFSIVLNIRLWLWPKSRHSIQALLTTLSYWLDPLTGPASPLDHIVIEASPSICQATNFPDIMNQAMARHAIQRLIIPLNMIQRCQSEKVTMASMVKTHALKQVIIDVPNPNDLHKALMIVNELMRDCTEIPCGVSITITERRVLAVLCQYIEQLVPAHKKRLILRLNKHHTLPFTTNDREILPLNTYYKWSVHTLVNIARNEGVQLLINTNNGHDIAWLLILRAQLNIEEQLQFETNVSKYPTIAKLLLMISQASVQSKSLVLDTDPLEQLTLRMNQLKIQAILFNRYHRTPYTTKKIFIKTHRRFFNHLRHNFLKIYRNHFKAVTAIK
jgi:hypothetical protein